MDPEAARGLVLLATGDIEKAEEARFKAIEADVDRKVEAAKLARQGQ